MTNLFIHLEVQEGERVHDHKVLHTTPGTKLALQLRDMLLLIGANQIIMRMVGGIITVVSSVLN